MMNVIVLLCLYFEKRKGIIHNYSDGYRFLVFSGKAYFDTLMICILYVIIW